MITKEKRPQFTTSNGRVCETIEKAKAIELLTLIGVGEDSTTSPIVEQIVAKPREAIAILKFGLPRKPRTTKPPMGKKPRRNLKREMPEIPGV